MKKLLLSLTLLTASSLLKSGWISATMAPYTMPDRASTMMTVTTLSCLEASGNNGRLNRRNPYVPSLTPANMTAMPIGPSSKASGSQVWNGNSGALKAKPRNSSQKIRICLLTGIGA